MRHAQEVQGPHLYLGSTHRGQNAKLSSPEQRAGGQHQLPRLNVRAYGTNVLPWPCSCLHQRVPLPDQPGAL